jgi:hypothetical protein
MKKNLWLEEPEEHDYPAAQDYLELVLDKDLARKKVDALREAKVEVKKAKDILRASGLALLTKKNIHVRENLRKVKKGKKLSPILLVKGVGQKLIVADGYHRICATYCLCEDLEIPCKLV